MRRKLKGAASGRGSGSNATVRQDAIAVFTLTSECAPALWPDAGGGVRPRSQQQNP